MKNINFHFPPIGPTTILRWAIGLIFFWFGIIKFFPEISPAEDLASNTLCVFTFHILSPSTCLIILAFLECLIGALLLTGKILKPTIILLFLHMLGTMLTFLVFPEAMFKHFPFVLSFQGQYVMKNLIIAAAGITIWESINKQETINKNPNNLDNHPTP